MTTASDIIDQLASDNNLTKAQSKSVFDGAIKAIIDAAKSGGETTIAGFGKFKVKESPAREGRNPATGKTIQIAASKKLTFAPAKALKDALNG